MSNTQRKRNKRKQNVQARQLAYQETQAYYAKQRAEQQALVRAYIRKQFDGRGMLAGAK